MSGPLRTIDKLCGALAAGVKLLDPAAKTTHAEGGFVVEFLGERFFVRADPAACECGAIEGVRWLVWTPGVLRAPGAPEPRPAGKYLLCPNCRARLCGKREG